ncbi:class A beta-lactamase-related serine hydrolase [Nocardia sp. CDC159]|uniref:Class A beta-lactamase-related serine hydrolase n=1 Tax=Nocardia pulmonis TaxID=2951408 RepID=A0A9X2E3V8_9NOCA|nr:MULTISPECIES: serine hydrolase [Nocardia]MCM6773627.1 class A beta-lactamase-related serine hydrolase [Nocardia pulmonis]MCM6786514.1 class A beta-lactamase-related serine hydrolase [Nocardia sp. CDC159]
MREIFDGVGVRGWLHARCLDCGAETGWRADELVVLSSVVKVPLVLELARQFAAGQLDPTDRVRATAADRLGGPGTSGCRDDVEYSLRDAAYLALSISDNTAADLLFDRVGLDNVRSLVRELGLPRTRIIGALRDLLGSMAEDMGVADAAEFARRYAAMSAPEIFALRILDSARTSASTPREMTRLLELIALDRAGPPRACAWLRELMGAQLNQHRLGSAFGDEFGLWGKTGTLPGIRNEIGVIETPDGIRCAVAVFTRAERLDHRLPRVDHAIGAAARAALESLDHRRPISTFHGRAASS